MASSSSKSNRENINVEFELESIDKDFVIDRINSPKSNKVNINVELESKEKDDRINPGLRKNSMWFQYWRFGLNQFYYVGILPFKFSYDEKQQRHSLTYNRLQMAFCFAMNIVTLNVMRVNLLSTVEIVRTSTDPLRYVDLAFHFNLIIFGIWCKILILFRAHRIVDLLQFLDQSPLLKISSQSSKTMQVMIGLYFFIYWAPSGVALYIMERGLDWQNLTWSSIKPTFDELAKAQFYFDESSKNSLFFPLVVTFGLLCFLFETFSWFYHDIIGIVAIFLVYTVSSDFVHHLKIHKHSKLEEIESREEHWKMMEMVGQYREVVRRVNNVFGLIICVYTTYCTSFYSMHVVDMLNNPDPMQRFLMITQVGGLVVSYYFAANTAMMARGIKIWLQDGKRWISFEHQLTALTLHDIREERFCVGSFFSITPGFVGQMASLLITIAIVVIGFQK